MDAFTKTQIAAIFGAEVVFAAMVRPSRGEVVPAAALSALRDELLIVRDLPEAARAYVEHLGEDVTIALAALLLSEATDRTRS